MKELTTEKIWTFDVGVGDGVDIPNNLKTGFMQRDRFNQQLFVDRV